MNRLVLELDMPTTAAGASLIARLSGYPVRYTDASGVEKTTDPHSPEDAEPDGEWETDA